MTPLSEFRPSLLDDPKASTMQGRGAWTALERAIRACQEFPARVEFPWSQGSAWDWLASQPRAWKLYWHGRNDAEVTAAWGVARCVSHEAGDTTATILARCRQLIANGLR
ncbi:MAG TPA: hypothetical protein VIY86_10720, partial [Pirellulaceae bacterium]